MIRPNVSPDHCPYKAFVITSPYNGLIFTDEEEEWDEEEEDEMILELREVWRQSTNTVSLLEESGDSLDGEDTEQIKV